MKSAFLIAFYVGIICIVYPIVAMIYFQTVEDVFVFNLIVGVLVTVFAKVVLNKKFANH